MALPCACGGIGVPVKTQELDNRLYDLSGADRSLRFSPYCWRAKMAMAHKGLAFEPVPTAYSDISEIGDGSFGSVPVLFDRGQLVGDSFQIARHLDKAYSHLPPLFEGPAHIASCRFLETWANSLLHPIVLRMIVKDIHSVLRDDDQRYFRETREARLGAILEKAQTGIEPNRQQLVKALAPARVVLEEQPWLGGDTPLFPDYIVFGTLMWLNVIAGFVPLSSDDPLHIWFEACLDLHDGFARQAERAA